MWKREKWAGSGGCSLMGMWKTGVARNRRPVENGKHTSWILDSKAMAADVFGGARLKMITSSGGADSSVPARLTSDVISGLQLLVQHTDRLLGPCGHRATPCAAAAAAGAHLASGASALGPTEKTAAPEDEEAVHRRMRDASQGALSSRHMRASLLSVTLSSKCRLPRVHCVTHQNVSWVRSRQPLLPAANLQRGTWNSLGMSADVA